MEAPEHPIRSLSTGWATSGPQTDTNDEQSTAFNHRLERLKSTLLERNSLGPIGNNPAEGWTIQNSGLANKITLGQFLAASKLEPAIRADVVGRCILQRNIDAVNKELSFEYRLEQAPFYLLDRVCLGDLQKIGVTRKVENSETWVALAEPGRFQVRKICSLAGVLRKSSWGAKVWQTTAYRLDHEDNYGKRSVAQNCDGVSIPRLPGKRVDCSIRRFRALPSDFLNKYASRLPVGACTLISDARLKELQFKKFSPKQLDRMMRGSGGEETLLKRLALLSESQRAYLRKHVKTELQQYLVTYPTLALSSLSSKEIHNLLSPTQGSYDKGTAARFHRISPPEVAAAIHKINGPRALRYLSVEQFKVLDFSELSRRKIDDLLLDCPREERTAKIHLIPPREIPRLMRGRKYTSWEFTLDELSQEQLQAVEFEKLEDEMFDRFLPLFTMEDLRRRKAYVMLESGDKVIHQFSRENETELIYGDAGLERTLDNRKAIFRKRWNRLSESQKQGVARRVGWGLDDLTKALIVAVS